MIFWAICQKQIPFDERHVKKEQQNPVFFFVRDTDAGAVKECFTAGRSRFAIKAALPDLLKDGGTVVPSRETKNTMGPQNLHF